MKIEGHGGTIQFGSGPEIKVIWCSIETIELEPPPFHLCCRKSKLFERVDGKWWAKCRDCGRTAVMK